MNTYSTRSGQLEYRVPVELTPREAEALKDLYESLFTEGEDPIATGLRKVAKAWGIEDGENRV